MRSKLKTINVPLQQLHSARSLGQIFRIAAGPGINPDPYGEAQSSQGKDSGFHDLALVAGQSMADTLVDGDVVALKRIDQTLEPVSDETTGLSANHISNLIEHDGIFALAINDEIDERRYTIKRVRIHSLKDGKWFGEILADNPEASWGDRGVVMIRKTDRVHFAAQVIGIVNRDNELAHEPAQSPPAAPGPAHAVSEVGLGTGSTPAGVVLSPKQ
jgi:hypothetical protein